MSVGAQDVLPTPSSASFGAPDSRQGHREDCYQRRLRHLTSIQIRNLTPFPVRDAFASALSQPATHSQFTALGNLSDDLDVTLLRKRSRRISTTSVNTLKNVTVEEITGVSDERADGEGRGRRRAHSRVGFSGGTNAGPTSGSGNTLSRSLVTHTSVPTAKPTRIRTASTMTSHSLSASFSSAMPTNSVSNIPVSVYFDHSQRTLERVVRSRLVETFITITVSEPPPPSPSPPSVSEKSRPREDSGPSPPIESPAFPNASVQGTRKGARTSRSASIGVVKTLSTFTTSHSTSRLSASKGKSHTMTRQVSSSSSAIKTHRTSSSVPLQRSLSHQSSLPSPAGVSVFPNVPNYISPIHRPSTNPLYSFDATSKCDFSEDTNLSTDRVRIQLWMKFDPSALHPGNGKQKDSDDTEGTSGITRWKVLEEWEFYFSDLIPLSPELESHSSQLPSNALVMTFLPTGQSFHLPPPAWSRSRSQSRTPSPSGYNTDPEGRKHIRSSEVAPSVSHDIIQGSQSILGVPRRPRKLEARTANWDEILQLVTRQASIRDTEESLHDAIRKIDLCLAKDHALILKRGVSQSEVRIEDRRAEALAIIESSDRLRDDLATRRMRMRARREYLAKAKELRAQETAMLSDHVAEVTEERSNLIAVRNRIPSIRTTLISTLATIYPIELLAASELLFTILAIPLPIPFNSHEPAPPLSLSSHKEVTEESVATALGYAAHLVQLLSVYMGKGLVYPITYIGSKSLIRDNISAMVGPRMFPLFSKGVDTYRFEYAVFLLNKDIEMLMAERDLRALDMRHTLPNLKNLLLTLTDGEYAGVHKPRYRESPSTSAASLRGSDIPKAGRSPSVPMTGLPPEPNVSLSSDATAPKAGPSEGTSTLSRYSKLSLGFPPLPGFFRSRHSPQTPTKCMTEAVEEGHEGSAFVDGGSEGTESSHSGKSEDDDDRRTIKGTSVDNAEQTETLDVKQREDGRALDGAGSAEEKAADAQSLRSVSTLVSVDPFV